MDEFIEWIVENGDINWVAVTVVVTSIIVTAILIYKHVAIKFNLPLWKWLKNTKFGPWDFGTGR